MPSAFMLRQASIIDWRFSRSLVADIHFLLIAAAWRHQITSHLNQKAFALSEEWLIIASQYSRTSERAGSTSERFHRESILGAIMTNAVLGIIGGSGIYD